MKLYEQGQYGKAIPFFEEALTQYFKADVECRALCEGPQRFMEQDHVLYRYSLYELISGESPRRRLWWNVFTAVLTAGKHKQFDIWVNMNDSQILW